MIAAFLLPYADRQSLGILYDSVCGLQRILGWQSKQSPEKIFSLLNTDRHLPTPE